VASFDRYRWHHHSDIANLYLPRLDFIYPIDLKDLRVRINKFRVTQYYRKKGINRNLINEAIENALKDNIEIPEFKTIGDVPPFEELYKIVDILLKKGYDQIKKHYLPFPDKSITEAKTYYKQNRKEDPEIIRIMQFSEKQAKLYIESFFKHLESCYKDFIEYCFPTFKQALPFFATLPHEYFFLYKGFRYT
jgi:predicted GNAT family acetyltransferase